MISRIVDNEALEITVSVEDQLAERARRYAESRGSSMDQLVKEYLALDVKAEADELVKI